MFFEREDVSVNLLEVLYLEQEDVRMVNSGRTFDALSFRYEADTQLKTEEENICVGTNSVCYFPARVQYTRVSKKDKMIVVHFNGVNLPTGKIQTFIPRNPEKLGELFQQMYDHWVSKEKGYRYGCTAIFYQILEEICKQSQGESPQKTVLAEGIAYIIENFNKPDVTVKEAADRANLSEVYFRKLFKEQFGVSPRKYIIDLRIKHAVTLLESGYYSLGEVAMELGYTDYKYFSAEFARVIGMPPSRYRYRFTERDLHGE